MSNLIVFCYNSLKFISIISLSTYISSLFSYFFVYKPLKNKYKNYTEFVPYQKKYYDEFFELDIKDLKEERLTELKNKIIKDSTPNGDVIMFYNHDTNSFWYYSNKKNIYYKYLDSVAMKYSIEYDCKKICIDRKYEYEKSLYKLEIPEKDKLEIPVKDKKLKKNVFANLKNYNNNSNNNYNMINKSNIYSYKGKLEDYDNNTNNTNLKNLKNNLSYSSFKKNKDISYFGE